MTRRMKFLSAGGAAVAACLLAVPGAGIYYQSSWGQGCARCHEIRIDYDAWQHSAHRKINCVECHSGTLARDLHRVSTHLRGEVPEEIHLAAADVFTISARCESCHREEAARWRSGPHSTTYARLFMDPDHNRKRALMDDCLRCHGMHFEGGIGDLVAAAGPAGPWQLKDATYVNRPAIPCLACHSMHRDGEPLHKGNERVGAKQEIVRPSVALFDRRTRMNLRVSELPLPAVLEGSRPVVMSPDRRQALCYQCHAPLADRQEFSGDDRTAVGVHEGLSCLACHANHDMQSRQSCAGCHPRLSNCGLDVEKMDTTFLNPKSPHDIHRVKCADCHPKGVPKRKAISR